MRGPFTGIGKSEPLKHLGSNIWSRRLTQEHRIVYWCNMIVLIFCRRDIIIRCSHERQLFFYNSF